MAIEWLTLFFQAFGLLFLAELGDKTQLVILTLASKGKSSRKLAVGAILGFAVIVFIGGIVALLLNTILEVSLISLISGLVFVLIAVFQIGNLIRKRENEIGQKQIMSYEEEQKSSRWTSDYLAGFLAIVSMELGDKTQVMTIVLSASSAIPIATLVGSWLALSALAVLGAYAGNWLSKKVPKKTMDWGATLLFLVIGIIMIVANI